MPGVCRVAAETEQWLEALEVSWDMGERISAGPGGDAESYLQCMDALAAAAAFFAERRAYKGAESSWQGLHSFTLQLNVSAFYGIGGACMGCKGVLGRVMGC
jgi:hypothetical protein